MKVNNSSVNVIRIDHAGYNMSFRQYITHFGELVPPDQNKELRITIQDSNEIDMLIQMLTEAKQNMIVGYRYHSDWKPEQ